jgi:hypothetical protein
MAHVLMPWLVVEWNMAKLDWAGIVVSIVACALLMAIGGALFIIASYLHVMKPYMFDRHFLPWAIFLSGLFLGLCAPLLAIGWIWRVRAPTYWFVTGGIGLLIVLWGIGLRSSVPEW